MKILLKAAVGLAGIAAISSPAAASVIVTFDDTAPISAANDFSNDLSDLGLTLIATSGATLTLDQSSLITFEFLGSESGFDDTFSALSVSYSEATGFIDRFGSPIALGSSLFAAGSLAGLLNFTSSGGASATVGNDGFGIFLGPNTASGDALSVFYLGYDDQITNQDDDHDDFIVRGTVTAVNAVPEAGTWAMMLLGLGAVGYGMRRGRSKKLAQIA